MRATPGAYMDRTLLESNPSIRLIEGMLLAGLAVGARQGLFYVRAEYPLAVRILTAAIDQAREQGLLGEKHPGQRVSPLTSSCFQGFRGLLCVARRNRPDPQRGRFFAACLVSVRPIPWSGGWPAGPRVINNVKTLAFVPAIVENGGRLVPRHRHGRQFRVRRFSPWVGNVTHPGAGGKSPMGR